MMFFRVFLTAFAEHIFRPSGNVVSKTNHSMIRFSVFETNQIYSKYCPDRYENKFINIESVMVNKFKTNDLLT